MPFFYYYELNSCASKYRQGIRCQISDKIKDRFFWLVVTPCSKQKQNLSNFVAVTLKNWSQKMWVVLAFFWTINAQNFCSECAVWAVFERFFLMLKRIPWIFQFWMVLNSLFGKQNAQKTPKIWTSILNTFKKQTLKNCSIFKWFLSGRLS